MSNESFDVLVSSQTVTAGSGPCWEGYKQIGMKKGKDGKMVPNCVPVGTSISTSDESELANKRTSAQTPAPKSDRIKGSSKNKKGSAKGIKAARKVKFSASVEKSLKEKVSKHNEKSSDGRKASLGMLKAVYRRGAGAFSVSHRPGMNRNQWAMGRVNAFLRLLKSGKPSNSAYTTDNDLLPASHPRSTKKSNSITAAGLVTKYGKFNEDETGIWAGYTPPAENEVADIGVTCANCVLYQGGDKCQIIALPVEPMGKCRFAVLPEGAVNIPDKPSMEDLQEYVYDQELMI